MRVIHPTIDIEEIKIRLIERLKPSGWSEVLRAFLLSSDFDRILDFLVDQRKQDKRFTPPLKTMFRAFELCPYDQLSVVLIGQDPYPQLGVADGLAFSCSNSDYPQPSLKFMIDAVKATNGGSKVVTDLSGWARQGVLLLNSALSVEINQVNSHQHIWHDFIVYLLDQLTHLKPGTVYMLLGKQARELEELIDANSPVLVATHPASAYHTEQKQWDCNDIFNECNRKLLDRDGSLILW